MRYMNLLIATVLLVASSLPAQDKALLSGGKEWKVIKSEEAPPGTKLTFANDGTVTLTFAVEGKAKAISGSYTLTGTQLVMKLNHDGKERVETRTIKKLTDTVLITEDKNKRVEELQR